MQYLCTDRQTAIQTRIKNPEKDPYIYGYLSYKKGDTAGHQRKNWSWVNQISIWKKYMKGPNKKAQIEFIYKKLCTYPYTFTLQSPSKHSPFDAMHISRRFFHCSKQFLNLFILMPLSTSAVFCFTSSTLAKRFPLRIFHLGKHKKKWLGVRSGEQGGWDTGVMPFSVKNW